MAAQATMGLVARVDRIADHLHTMGVMVRNIQAIRGECLLVPEVAEVAALPVPALLVEIMGPGEVAAQALLGSLAERQQVAF